MIKEFEVSVDPKTGFDPSVFRRFILQKLQLPDEEKIAVTMLRRSVDARSRDVKVNILVRVSDEVKSASENKYIYKNVSQGKSVIIVGAGPAGIFAALRLIELGCKPIILERGKDVQTRRRDLVAINKDHIVNPDSNYCFGEGGAGTYSDGKLYTRSKKRGDLRRVLEIMVQHGAREEILVDAHPHIGTNKLPKLVADLRDSILNVGGEIHFDTRVTDFVLEFGTLTGVVTASGEKYKGIGVILATGHSARDIFYLLQSRNVLIEAKPFAMGVRIEHAQSIIDRIQYHCEVRDEFLPAASYSLVNQVNWQGQERGVFSFCMCPGGFIVPAATSQEEVVVNGMSPSRRDSKFANSGIVVAIDHEDLKPFQKEGVFAGLVMQQEMERKAWLAGGKTQVAPAQRMADFVDRKISNNLPESSYQPGLKSVNMDEVLFPGISSRLRDAFKVFGKKMKGYFTNEAQIVGVESRTSSPVSVPRNKETLEHLQVKRLFPCGEGAGYAGGIVSAAMDGERCAEAVVKLYG